MNHTQIKITAPKETHRLFTPCRLFVVLYDGEFVSVVKNASYNNYGPIQVHFLSKRVAEKQAKKLNTIFECGLFHVEELTYDVE